MRQLIEPESRRQFQRGFRLRRRRLVRAGREADAMVDKHFFHRLEQVGGIRRFLASWLALVVLLIAGVLFQTMSLGKYYLAFQPAAGGTYREGVLGSYTNANPIYATSLADTSVSALVFSGLLTYKADNTLTANLAKEWSTDESGRVYTVVMRDDVRWHDGTQFTAADVVFTFQTIQNADARSPLFRNWQGVTVTSPDEQTVTFSLPSALSGFEHSLTTGILPKHLLENVEPSQLRSASFNSLEPVGTGPFKYRSVEVTGGTVDDRQELVSLDKYDNYHRGGPELENYSLRVFRNGAQLLSAFNKREINAAIGLNYSEINEQDGSVTTYNIPQSSSVMVFLNNSSPLLNDVKVRQALTMATDTNAIINSIGYPLIKVDQPFLREQVGYDPAFRQFGFNFDEANRLFDEAGWKKNSGKVREKDGKTLKIRLFSQSLAEYALVVQKLQEQWGNVGVEVDAILQPEEDLQTGAIARHDYDALLYGIAIGPDSDIFPYWHSSQADPRSQTRLNLSEFKNAAADAALEAGRTRSDPTLRAIKYKPFLEAWKNQAPSIGLYQPRFFYVVRGDLSGFGPYRLNSVSDRFRNVHLWTIRQERTTTN